MFNGAPSGGTGYVGGHLAGPPAQPELSLREMLALKRLAASQKKNQRSKGTSAAKNARTNGFKDRYGAREGFGGNFIPGMETQFSGSGIL